MKRKHLLAAALAALIQSAAIAQPQWGTPTHVGDCYAPTIERDALRRAALVAGWPQSWVGATVIYCDPWTPFPGVSSATFQQLGQDALGCTDRRYWTWWIGCARGVVSHRINRVAILRMHPRVADTMIGAAQQMGMSSGSRTWAEIRCLFRLRDLVSLFYHEWNHVRGYSHGDAMTAEDRRLYRLYDQRYGGWTRDNEWGECR